MLLLTSVCVQDVYILIFFGILTAALLKLPSLDQMTVVDLTLNASNNCLELSVTMKCMLLMC